MYAKASLTGTLTISELTITSPQICLCRISFKCSKFLTNYFADAANSCGSLVIYFANFHHGTARRTFSYKQQYSTVTTNPSKKPKLSLIPYTKGMSENWTIIAAAQNEIHTLTN